MIPQLNHSPFLLYTSWSPTHVLLYCWNWHKIAQKTSHCSILCVVSMTLDSPNKSCSIIQYGRDACIIEFEHIFYVKT